MKIGVFDSGIGGLSVAKALEKAVPQVEVLFMHDTPEHFPYATKSPDRIYGFILPIFQQLTNAQCDAIVVACNTVSTTLIDRLRAAVTTPLIAVEPMIKFAVDATQSHIVAVCATPTTLASKRYAWLKETYGAGCTFLEPDCSDWSYLIEYNQMNEGRIRSSIEPVLRQRADVIVLGCTHYHWIENHIKAIAQGRAQVLQPEAAIVRQVKELLGLA